MIEFSSARNDDWWLIGNLNDTGIAILTLSILIVIIFMFFINFSKFLSFIPDHNIRQPSKRNIILTSMSLVLIVSIFIYVETGFSRHVVDVSDVLINYEIVDNTKIDREFYNNVIIMESKGDRLYKISFNKNPLNYNIDRFKNIMEHEPKITMETIDYFNEISAFKITTTHKDPKYITLFSEINDLTPQEFDKFLDILEKTTYK